MQRLRPVCGDCACYAATAPSMQRLGRYAETAPSMQSMRSVGRRSCAVCRMRRRPGAVSVFRMRRVALALIFGCGTDGILTSADGTRIPALMGPPKGSPSVPLCRV